MPSAQVEAVAVVAAVAAACAIPGSFLVLRRVALLADAISHVLLFGIVVSFLVVRDLASPWLLIGAAASGVLTVAIVETLQRSRLVKSDAAIGLVFPALFSLGTLLATIYLRNTHLDVDRVLLGSAELAPYDRMTIDGMDIGPRGFVVLSIVFVLNAALVVLFFKELKLSTFDAALAATLGFAPALLHYGLMTIVSLTTVAAFDAVGPVVVVALLVVPAATAYLLTDRLAVMIVLSVVIAIAAAIGGTLFAFEVDANIGGTVATVLGLLFSIAFLLAPGRGLLAALLRRLRQRRQFLETMLAIHLYQHEGTSTELDESRLDGLHRHLHWLPIEVTKVTIRAERNGLVASNGERLRLTDEGRLVARRVLKLQG